MSVYIMTVCTFFYIIFLTTKLTSVFANISGFHADLNETYAVGEVDDESKRLIRATRECLDEAIKICKPGALFRDIGKVMYVVNLSSASSS